MKNAVVTEEMDLGLLRTLLTLEFVVPTIFSVANADISISEVYFCQPSGKQVTAFVELHSKLLSFVLPRFFGKTIRGKTTCFFATT